MLASLTRTVLVATAVAVSLFVLVVVASPEPPFADRWTGSCTGWTKPLATVHAIADLVMFLAYLGVSISIGSYHPRMDRVRSSHVTVGLVAATFGVCACVHFVEAFSTFHPAYRFSAALKSLAALVAVFGWWFITMDLKQVRVLVQRDRNRLNQMDAQLGAAELTRAELSNRSSPEMRPAKNGKG